jgi:NhaP-type Na+/H+ or K+/H+ antiporter
MPRRLAAAVALLAFVVCLIVGRVQAQNDFATTVTRALYAMLATFAVGWVVGLAGQRMVDETVPKAPPVEKNEEKSAGIADDDR